MKTIIIPERYGFPTVDITINGVMQTFNTGIEVEVSDEVASLIEEAEAMYPVVEENAHLPDGIVIRSSTAGSTKKLKISVNDGGVITAKVITE